MKKGTIHHQNQLSVKLDNRTSKIRIYNERQRVNSGIKCSQTRQNKEFQLYLKKMEEEKSVAKK